MARKLEKKDAKTKKLQPMSKTKLKKKEAKLIFPGINDGECVCVLSCLMF